MKNYKNIIKFYNYFYGIDVSKVVILEERMDGIAGQYRPFFENRIFINPDVKGVARESTIVHELNHLCQIEHGKGISMNIELLRKKFNLGNDVVSQMMTLEDWHDLMDYDPDYEDQPLEIDSRLAEVMYINFMYGFDNAVKCHAIVTRYGLGPELPERIENLPEGEIKDFFMNWVKEEEENADNNFAELYNAEF